MLQHYNEQLAELKGRERKRNSWQQQEKNLKDEWKRKQHERDQWEKQLQKEQKDVDALRGISLGALFYTLVGKKDEKLTQEEAEVLEVKLKYDEAVATVEDLEQEWSELKDCLMKVRYIDADIESLMKAKVSHIMEAHPELAVQLKELSDQEVHVQANVKEVDEAVKAGRSVHASLKQAQEKLESARNWGTYDMLGGGMIATSIKHSRIDDARSSIHDAQRSMRRFQTELKDVQRNVNMTIDISGMLTFADYFFDGFFMDWMVQGRINTAAAQVAEKSSEIHSIVSQLEIELRKEESKLSELRRRRSALVESA